MATTTANLGLTKPDYTEKADIAVINGNMDKIDAAMQQRDRVWNLLDNSDFRNPVNQRGNTTYSASGYTIDRWRTWDNGAVTVREGYISHEVAIYQTIGVKLDPAKKYTFAVMNTDNVVTVVSGFITNDLWENGLHLIYNEGNPYVRIQPEAHIKNIVWAALYEGEYTAETLPAYVPKGYAAELLECQRYYYSIPDNSDIAYVGFSASATLARITIQTPVPMIAKPTLSVGEVSKINLYAETNTGATTAIHCNGYDGNAATLYCTASNLTAWKPCVMRFNTPAALSADL